jgi:uncharacterized membrane protein YhaH (DUF805 family)
MQKSSVAVEYRKAFFYTFLTLVIFSLLFLFYLYAFDLLEKHFSWYFGKNLKAVLFFLAAYINLVFLFTPAIKEFKRVHQEKIEQ